MPITKRDTLIGTYEAMSIALRLLSEVSAGARHRVPESKEFRDKFNRALSELKDCNDMIWDAAMNEHD